MDATVFNLITTTYFAAVKHRDQRRKDASETPYINHPIGVANIIVEEGKVFDTAVVQAALLHDTVEDTDTRLDEIRTQFGDEVLFSFAFRYYFVQNEKVADLVAEVTDDKTLPKLERKRLQIEHAPHTSYKAKLVKLADKLYNLCDLQNSTPVGWSQERVDEYYVWAAKVVKGLRGTNKLLEQQLDLVFQSHGEETYKTSISDN